MVVLFLYVILVKFVSSSVVSYEQNVLVVVPLFEVYKLWPKIFVNIVGLMDRFNSVEIVIN